MQFVEPPSDMGKTGRQRHTLIGGGALGEPIVGRVTVHLQQAAKARQMTRDTISAPAVFKAIGHHRGTCAAEGSVITGIGP